MKIFKAIIMSIGIAAAAMTASAQNDEFRLKWAENDGWEWKITNLGGEKLCSLVSFDAIEEYTEPVYTKIVAMPPDNTIMLFVSNLDCEGVKSLLIYIDGKAYSVRDLKSKYADYSVHPNMIGKDIAGVNKATIIMFEDARVSEALRSTMGIQINIQAPDGWLRFNFSVSHPME